MAIAAACFAAFTLPVVTGLASGAGSRPAIAFFGVLAAAPLVVRRRWPLAVLAVVTGVYVASTLLGVQFTPFVSSAGPNLAIATLTVADRYDRRSSLLAYGLAALATWAVLPLGIHLHPGLDQDSVQPAAMIAGWFAGDAIRTRGVTGSAWTRSLVSRRTRERPGSGPRSGCDCHGRCTMWSLTASA